MAKSKKTRPLVVSMFSSILTSASLGTIHCDPGSLHPLLPRCSWSPASRRPGCRVKSQKPGPRKESNSSPHMWNDILVLFIHRKSFSFNDPWFTAWVEPVEHSVSSGGAVRVPRYENVWNNNYPHQSNKTILESIGKPMTRHD